jgi:hypothetical protein
MKRKWLKVLMMLMMAWASLGSPMNPKKSRTSYTPWMKLGLNSRYLMKTTKEREVK